MSKAKKCIVRQSKGSTPVTVNLPVGANVTDPFWQEVGVSQDSINKKAIKSYVIEFQASARRNWARFSANPDAYATSYTAGRQATAVQMTAEQVQAQKFTPENIAFLRSIGVEVPTLPVKSAKK